MPTGHIKPLFHEKTLAKAMAGFALPANTDARRAVVARRVSPFVMSEMGRDVKLPSTTGSKEK